MTTIRAQRLVGAGGGGQMVLLDVLRRLVGDPALWLCGQKQIKKSGPSQGFHF